MTRVGIIGGGWPGVAHAAGYRAAGGFGVVAVADPIPDRQRDLAADWPKARAYADAKDVIADREVEAVSVCLPTHLRTAVALAAMKAGKHVMVETPPAATVREAKQLAAAATRYGRVLAYAFQRRFGGAELAAAQAVAKGYAGDPVHVRATWMRTRGVPVGTGWYTDRARAGGGALIDLGTPLLDVAWTLLGRPTPVTAFAVTRQGFRDLAPADAAHDVEDSAVAIVRFDGGRSLELTVSWAINQAPAQQGTACRVYGTAGAVEVYTPAGPVLYRVDEKGRPKETALRPPNVVGHAALLRQFREAILGRAPAAVGPDAGVALMQVVEAMYRSAETGRSAEVKAVPAAAPDGVAGEGD